VLGGKPAAKQDNSRINEMVSHLQETCESKDEVLVRLFDLTRRIPHGRGEDGWTPVGYLNDALLRIHVPS